MKIKRVPTGIKGFDSLVEGGLPRGSIILITGTPGTGKTIFGLQYLYNGATKFKERSLYVNIGIPTKTIIEQASMFGWDVEKLINTGKLQFLEIPVKDLDQNISDMIVKKIQSENIDRVVIDSVSILATNAPLFKSLNDVSVVDIMEKKSIFSPPVLGDYTIKRFVYTFIDSLRRADDCTILIISEASENSEYLSRDTISEFACDGVIIMNYLGIGEVSSRTLTIRKMRSTNQYKESCPFEIAKKGIIIDTKGLI